MGKLDALFGGKERELFARFSLMGNLIAQAGEAFQTLAKDLPNAKLHAKRLHEIEHTADDTVAQIFSLLNTTSHFSLEHEDIATLTQRSDDVIDHIWGAAKRVVRHNLNDPDPELLEAVSVIISMTQEIADLFKNLKNPKRGKNLQKLIDRFHTEESRADEFKDEVSRRRYESADTPEKVKLWIAWEKVFDHLESATDHCVDITDVIGHFSKKYGY
jgi:hypothetical protein